MYMKVISSDIRKIIIVVVGAIKNLNQNQSHEVRIKVHMTFTLCDDPNAERELSEFQSYSRVALKF